MEETNQKKRKFNRKQKYLLLRSMIILVVLLVVNTFAWFLMSTRTALSMNVHIDSWQITFEDEEGEESENFVILIDRAYPGMDDYTKVFTITNSGERDADLEYAVVEARLLDTHMTVEDGTTTHEQIESYLENEVPFYFGFEFSNTSLSHNTGSNTETFTFTMSWSYEATDPSQIEAKDELDTQWGQDAYSYYEEHASDPAPANTGDDDTRYAIYIKVNLVAKQTP